MPTGRGAFDQAYRVGLGRDRAGTGYATLPPGQARTAIQDALARGVKVMMATGRTYASSAAYARELGLPAGPLIAYNGAEVREYPGGELLRAEPVAMADACTVITFCQEHRLHLHIYQNDLCCASLETAWTDRYRPITGISPVQTGDLLTLMRQNTPKQLIMGTEEQLRLAEAGLAERLGERVHLARSFPFMLEITHPLATKGRALQWVAARLGLDRSEVMAIGDGANDADMIRWAGTGVAMNHAAALVKGEADWVAPGGTETGVADSIQRFVLS